MQIKMENAAKRYRFEWIFKELNFYFKKGENYALLGHNGSGKSTLMQVLSGYLSLSKGKIFYTNEDKAIDINEVYQYISFTAPYIELIEEFTLRELIKFHWNFKEMQLTQKAFFERLELPLKTLDQQIKFFSSGMQQRVKLGLSICSKAGVLLLDEPTITLDRQGILWYIQLLETFAIFQEDRLCIIASNIEEDFALCTQQINILDYK